MRRDALMRAIVGKIAWVLIVLGFSSIVIALFLAFYFSGTTGSGLLFMSVGVFRLEEYGPIFFIVGLGLLAVGWILCNYAMRPARQQARAQIQSGKAHLS